MTLPLGFDLMKETGGTVEVLSLQQFPVPMGVLREVAYAKVTFRKVPCHNSRATTTRLEYLGPGEASFVIADDGHMVLSSAYLLDLTFGAKGPPAYWRPDRANRGIRVPE